MSLMDHAESELKRINFGDSDTAAMLAILRMFFDNWDSGGAVWCVAPILQKLIAGQPLSPLTGNDDEWNEVGSGVFQNKRDSSVFKDADGRAYDIATPGRPTIAFPYSPTKAEVPSPVIQIGG